MAHPSNSYSTVLADLTAAVTATANADFATPPFLAGQTAGVATAGVGGVVPGILPDTILVNTGGVAVTLQLPKIGTQACPVGSTVNIRKMDAGVVIVTITASIVGGADLIDGAATNVTALPAAATVQTVMLRACSINLTTNVGQWRTIGSSLPNI